MGNGGNCGNTCRCLPYGDGFVIAAQLISIAAFLISWFFWVTFIVGFISMILLQVLWCCRQGRIGLYISAAISMVAAVSCTFAGIFMIVGWKNQYRCNLWYVVDPDARIYAFDNGTGSDGDKCAEGTWAIVSFITAVLWYTATGCILYFVKSGRHTKFEEQLQLRDATTTTTTTPAATTTTATAIEMGSVVQQHRHNDNDDDDNCHHQQQQQQEQQSTMGTTAVPIATAAYIIPEVPNKIDNV